MLSRWIANTKRVMAKDKITSTQYEFESVFPDGAPDGTAFSSINMNKIVDEVNQNTPPGLISTYAGSSAPTGYLLCQGQAVSRTTYSALYAVLGTKYGAGDGSTTFHLPNLKGKVPVGYDSAQPDFNVLGKYGGEKTHALTKNEVPSLLIKQVERAYDKGEWVPDTHNDIASFGHNNLQPYITLNYIIKY